MRNSSPKPGRRRSNSGATASGVRSRGEMPVPPVTRTASLARASRATSSRNASGSSARIASATTAKPAASSNRRSVCPPSLVAAVRLSEAVTIATRTSDAAGACERWCPAGDDEDDMTAPATSVQRTSSPATRPMAPTPASPSDGRPQPRAARRPMLHAIAKPVIAGGSIMLT